jgi:hypothetical protein
MFPMVPRKEAILRPVDDSRADYVVRKNYHESVTIRFACQGFTTRRTQRVDQPTPICLSLS